MRERAAEHRPPCGAAGWFDAEFEFEVPAIAGLRGGRMHLAIGILQTKPHRLRDFGARLLAVVDQPQANALLVRSGCRHSGRLARSRRNWKQDGGQNCDDRNDDQKFNKSECFCPHENALE